MCRPLTRILFHSVDCRTYAEGDPSPGRARYHQSGRIDQTVRFRPTPAEKANAIVRRIDGASDIKVAFLNGPIATVIGYFEQKTDVTEAGARVDLRRTSTIEGPNHHRGAEGVSIAPVGGGGGLWRADLLVELETQKSCYHYHPAFRDNDVGDRFFDQDLDRDPLGWIEGRLADLPSLLEEASAPDLTASVDLAAHRRSLHSMMSLIESALARVPLARTSSQGSLQNV